MLSVAFSRDQQYPSIGLSLMFFDEKLALNIFFDIEQINKFPNQSILNSIIEMKGKILGYRDQRKQLTYNNYSIFLSEKNSFFKFFECTQNRLAKSLIAL